MHRRVCLLGVAALLLLAVWLWEQEACGCHGVGWADPDMAERHAAEEDRAEPDRGLIVTYDAGRTTIPPKVSAETIARIRGQ